MMNSIRIYHLHYKFYLDHHFHKKEDKYTAKELIARKEYYYVDPSELVWLTIEEHEAIHREINKLPWRIEIETRRVKHMKQSMKAWSEERKETRAKEMRDWWDPRSEEGE